MIMEKQQKLRQSLLSYILVRGWEEFLFDIVIAS